ncbi:hypothetical protein [Micromonospora sp. NPDC050695]|uniref:hypothetical protein n=1 Tax=Micromonospora sp. NPDC050695 TaxID=3154938 RepID=UPI0033D6CB33
MGHASMRAALVYQHANSERDREIADAMDRRIVKQTKQAATPAKASKPKNKAAKDKPATEKAAKKNAPKQKPAARKAAKKNAPEEKPAARKAAKGGKAERPARDPASDGTASATGTLLARKIKDD